MRVFLSLLLISFFAVGCGEAESKPFEFDENLNNSSNSSTANNATSNSSTANNTSANNSTSGNNTSANNSTTGGCVIPEPPEHRPMATECDKVRPPGSGDNNMMDFADCEFDTDCIDNMGSVNGRCTLSRGGAICTYDSCFADSDCGSGVCHCEGGWSADNNTCKTAGNCRVDSDCGEGSYCSPSLGSCGDYGGVEGWFCRTCEDECTSDADCPDNVNGGGRGFCGFDGEKWSCSNDFCVG